jgi:hypothetical protein
VGQVRKRLTYANVVSSLALFIALSGATAFAVQQLPEKSVGERQLRPGAVTASKLRKNAVTAPKIKAEAVKSGKLANGAVQVNKIGTGAVSGEKLADGAVIGDKIANDTVSGDKIVESTLSEVPSAGKAGFATAAESANPVAFARVKQEGGVDSANSKGIANADVTRPEKGVYCIKVPAFSPRGGQATAETDVSNTDTIAQLKVNGASKCAAPGVEVRTWSTKTQTAVDAVFYVVLYQ